MFQQSTLGHAGPFKHACLVVYEPNYSGRKKEAQVGRKGDRVVAKKRILNDQESRNLRGLYESVIIFFNGLILRLFLFWFSLVLLPLFKYVIFQPVLYIFIGIVVFFQFFFYFGGLVYYQFLDIPYVILKIKHIFCFHCVIYKNIS